LTIKSRSVVGLAFSSGALVYAAFIEFFFVVGLLCFNASLPD
jgi:hypothetical protein